MMNRNPIRYCSNFLLLVLLAGCERPRAPVVNQAARPAPPRENAVLDCTGTIHPARIYKLRLKPNESVRELLVEEGAEVVQGAPLVLLACPDLQTELISAREKMLGLRREAGRVQELGQKREAAASRLAELKARLEMDAPLQTKVDGYDPRVHARPLLDEITRTGSELSQLDQELENLEVLERQSKPLVKALEDRTAEIEKQISELRVRAPFSGTVARLSQVADLVDGAILELQDRSSFSVHGALWQNQVQFVRVGSEATVSPDFIQDRQWTGHVSAIGFAPEAGSTGAFPRFPMVVSLPAVPEGDLLRDGMTVFMQIRGAQTDGPARRKP